MAQGHRESTSKYPPELLPGLDSRVVSAFRKIHQGKDTALEVITDPKSAGFVGQVITIKGDTIVHFAAQRYLDVGWHVVRDKEGLGAIGDHSGWTAGCEAIGTHSQIALGVVQDSELRRHNLNSGFSYLSVAVSMGTDMRTGRNEAGLYVLHRPELAKIMLRRGGWTVAHQAVYWDSRSDKSRIVNELSMIAVNDVKIGRITNGTPVAEIAVYHTREIAKAAIENKLVARLANGSGITVETIARKEWDIRD